MQNSDINILIQKTLSNNNCEDIIELDVKEKSSITDTFIVASCTSNLQVSASAKLILKMLKDNKVKNINTHGIDVGNWALIDIGNTIVHIFRHEVRDYYNITEIWSDSIHTAEK